MSDTHKHIVDGLKLMIDRFQKNPFSFFNEQDCRAFIYQHLIDKLPELVKVENATCKLHLEYPIDPSFGVTKPGRFDLVILKDSLITINKINLFNLSRPADKRSLKRSGVPFEALCEIKFCYQGPGRSKDVNEDFERMHQVKAHAENVYVIYLQRMLSLKELSDKTYESLYKKWLAGAAVEGLKKHLESSNHAVHYLYFAVFCDEIGNKQPFGKEHILTNLGIEPS